MTDKKTTKELMMTNNKFTSVPVEKDTKVLSRKVIKIGELDARVEKWKWEGIKAQSVIFVEADIVDKSDEQLIALIKESLELASNVEITISRNRNGFAFFNVY